MEGTKEFVCFAAIDAEESFPVYRTDKVPTGNDFWVKLAVPCILIACHIPTHQVPALLRQAVNVARAAMAALR